MLGKSTFDVYLAQNCVLIGHCQAFDMIEMVGSCVAGDVTHLPSRNVD